MNQDVLDRFEIGTLIQNWALWRDTGDWDKLRTTFHPGGTMTATWFHGPFEDFIESAKASWRKQSRSQHVLGGTTVELRGRRALAQTRMAIMVRTLLDGVEVDVVCHGRFFDRVERRDGVWRIARRNPIYEMDRIDPVDPAATLTLDRAHLERFPEGYRHLAYVQSRAGATINMDLPTARGAALDTLLGEARAWLTADHEQG
jgi:hypothetical protein